MIGSVVNIKNPELKYYSMVFRLGRELEKAVIVKAISRMDAEILIKNWRGVLMSVTEIIVDSHMQKSLMGGLE
jgi:hypothetical protein